MEVTEGIRVYFDDGGPIYLCFGRDDDNLYFQDESGMQTFIPRIPVGCSCLTVLCTTVWAILALVWVGLLFP